jgi:hypothetical protein
MLGLSERQLWRLRVAYRKEGAAGLIHRNRGHSSKRRVARAVAERVVELAESAACRGCNQVHLTELLAEQEGLRLSRSTVRFFPNPEFGPSPSEVLGIGAVTVGALC